MSLRREVGAPDSGIRTMPADPGTIPPVGAQLGGGGNKYSKIAKAAKVKNKAPADLQITAEQLLREAKERELEIVPAPPKQKIQDADELADYQMRKRKAFEDALRKNKSVMSNWIKYASWEESQGQLDRSRSVYERALDVDHRSGLGVTLTFNKPHLATTLTFASKPNPAPQEHRSVAEVHGVRDEEQAGEPREEPVGPRRHHPAARLPVLVQVHLHGGDAQQHLGCKGRVREVDGVGARRAAMVSPREL